MNMISTSPLMNAILDELRMQPEVSFADLKARLNMKGFVVAPILYGRAKRMLGLITTPSRAKQVEGSEESAALEMEVGSETPTSEEEEVSAPLEPAHSEVRGSGAEPGLRTRGRPFSELSKFMEDFLRTNPDVSYAEASNAATAKGLAPNLGAFSRTKARLGLGRKNRSSVVVEATPKQEEVQPTVAKEPVRRSGDGNFAQQISAILASAQENKEAEERLEHAIREAIAVLSAALEPEL